MGNYKFVFDLDSTITKEETLPIIAKELGMYNEIKVLTEKAMNGEQDFEKNFINRINIIKNINLEKIHKIIEKVEFNKYIEKFILENKERCLILTGNLDLIIKPILKRLDMENRYFSCIGTKKDGKIFKVDKVINKKDVAQKFDFKFVAIGDGNNDIGMLEKADIGIAFGGCRNLSKEIKDISDYIFYSDKELYQFLNKLL